MKRTLTFMVIFVCGILLVTMVRAEEVKSAKFESRCSKILVPSKVIEALGKIGSAEARDVLLEAMRSKEYFIRAYAAEALSRIQDKESISLLKKLTNDENYLVRIQAVCALYDLGQKDVEELLFAFLKNDNPTVRATTVARTGKLGDKFLLTLAEMLPQEKENVVQVKLIEQLGANRFKPALEYINSAITNSNPDVRRAACWAAGKIGDKKSIPLLLEKLGDGDVLVRSTAKVELAKLGESDLIKVFWDDVEDKDPLMRGSSYVALAILKDLDILPILLKEIVNPESPTIVKIEAARALAILKPYISKLVNEALVKSDNKYNVLLSENLEATYKVNGKSLILIFMEALREDKDPLHQDAPLILKEIDDNKISLPVLREALLEDNPDLVATAAYVLGELRDKDAVDYLIRVFKKYGI